MERFGRTDRIHHLVLRDETDLDGELEGWIREACAVGAQAHLTERRRG